MPLTPFAWSILAVCLATAAGVALSYRCDRATEVYRGHLFAVAAIRAHLAAESAFVVIGGVRLKTRSCEVRLVPAWTPEQEARWARARPDSIRPPLGPRPVETELRWSWAPSDSGDWNCPSEVP